MSELLAMNIPFVTNKGWGDVESIVPSGEGGILLDDFKLDSMVAAVGKLMEFSSNKGRPIAENYFSLSRGIQSYRELYARILTRQKAGVTDLNN